MTDSPGIQYPHEHPTATTEGAAGHRQPGDSLYRMLVDLSPDAIVIHAGGRIVFINQAGADILHTSIEDVLDRPIVEFIHPGWHEMVATRVREMIATGRPGPRTPLRFIRRDGTEVIGDTTSVPFDHDGQPAILVSIRDITAQVQGEAERMRLIDEQSAYRKKHGNDQRFLIDVASVLNSSLDYNATLANLAQLSVPYLADGCIVEIQEGDGSIVPVAIAHIDPDQVELAYEMRRRYPIDPSSSTGTADVLRRGESVMVPVVSPGAAAINARDPEHQRLREAFGIRSLMQVPLRSRGQSLGVITFAMTSSGRVYGASDLALAEDVAAHAGMAVDNARLYRDAQEALRLRDEFLSVASHELRTPITALQLQLQLLQRTAQAAPPGDPLSERVARLSGIADRQMRRLAQLVNDLLDVSQISEGRLRLHRERVDLGALTADIVERLEQQFRIGGCEVRTIVTSVTGFWDRARVEQALTNLLTNAIKYGAGTPVEITVEGDGQVARIAVRDFGMGIVAEDIDRIFERYERAVPVRHYGGMGLGLHIAREMIEAHGGQLSVDTEPGRGSTFTIHLPLEQQ